MAINRTSLKKLSWGFVPQVREKGKAEKSFRMAFREGDFFPSMGEKPNLCHLWALAWVEADKTVQ